MLIPVTVSSAPLAVLVTAEPNPSERKTVKSANEAFNLLVSSSDVLEALVVQSAPLVPVRSSQILSSLWGLISTGGQRNISKQDVETAVLVQGGSSSSAAALWKLLNPEGNATITPGDFAKNEYLFTAVQVSMDAVVVAVEETRTQQALVATRGGSVLDIFGGGGGGVLDLFV